MATSTARKMFVNLAVRDLPRASGAYALDFRIEARGLCVRTAPRREPPNSRHRE